MNNKVLLGAAGVLVSLIVGFAAQMMSTEPTRAVRTELQDAVDANRYEKEGGTFERGQGISKVIEAHELDVFLQSEAGPLVPGPDAETLARAHASKIKAEKALEEFHALQLQQLAQFRSTVSE